MSFDPIANGWRKLLKDGGAGYTEKKKLFEETCVFTHDGTAPSVFTTGVFDIINGQIYTVTFDGVAYRCVGVVEVSEDATLSFIGNIDLVFGGVQLDGEPFGIIDGRPLGAGEAFVISATTEGTHTILIETETIHPIDPKYLPSGGGGSIPDDFMECAVIDLSECVDSNSGVTVEQVFFMVFQNGGGTYPSAMNQGKLWETLDTFGNRPIKVVIHTDLMGVTGGTIETTRVNLMRVNGQVHQLSFECAVVDPSSGISVNALCVLTFTGNGKGTVSVKVEPLEFP